MSLTLRVRTPEGLLVDRAVERVIAEDADGWFGIAPGRRDLVAALLPGLLVFRDREGEAFVALGGGLLELRNDECRVLCRDAVVVRSIDQIAERVEALLRSRRARSHIQRGVVAELVREALRRIGLEARHG